MITQHGKQEKERFAADAASDVPQTKAYLTGDNSTLSTHIRRSSPVDIGTSINDHQKHQRHQSQPPPPRRREAIAPSRRAVSIGWSNSAAEKDAAPFTAALDELAGVCCVGRTAGCATSQDLGLGRVQSTTRTNPFPVRLGLPAVVIYLRLTYQTQVGLLPTHPDREHHLPYNPSPKDPTI
ncbi:hypothetical protein CVT26_005296 [Gymnopilus dilepis]|uniref:Uncharacterized protein n=1 Tax=Gymnopilus dilepis TaxID=231916 RepID=A0A409YSW0_9AGAR|nr:hypothetical protein CVT26_005296 [Gymnopilus dilepis]